MNDGQKKQPGSVKIGTEYNGMKVTLVPQKGYGNDQQTRHQ